jgi:poly(A) polymerase
VGQGGGVFPVLDAALAQGPSAAARERFVRLALQDTDQRVAEGRAVAPSFMLACMLWHDVQERWTAIRATGEAPFPALQQAVDAVFEARIGDISGRGKLAADMREIWLMQPRLERRSASSALALVEGARFRAGYDFLRLRADCDEISGDLADWWEDLHLGNDEDREALLADLRAQAPARPRRAPGAVDAEDGARTPAAPVADGDDAAPRKRRRRRRKPGAREGAAPSGE